MIFMPIGDKEGFTKIWCIDLGSRLGVLRPRALTLHMTLWTKLKITERTPKLFSFSCAPHFAYFAERMGTRGIRAAQKAFACGGQEGGSYSSCLALQLLSHLSLPSLPSPPPFSLSISHLDSRPRYQR